MRGRHAVADLTSIVLTLFFALVIWCWPVRATADTMSATVADFRVENGVLFLELRINAEAFLGGVDLDGSAGNAETTNSNRYQSLRAMPSVRLEPLVRDYFLEWKNSLVIEAGGRLALSYEGARIPVVGNTDVPRKSVLLITAELPPGARSLRLTWPQGAGSVVLRQQGVDAPYTGFLRGGETSPPIPLAGGASMAPKDSFQAHVPAGFSRIVPDGKEQILFVLGLFFLSHRSRPLTVQFGVFSLALAVGLAARLWGTVAALSEVLAPLIAVSISFVALENIFVRHLHLWRVLAVFAFGLLHGFVLADALDGNGLPPAQLVAAMGGFYAGVEMALLAVIAAAFLSVGLWFRKRPWYRGRIAIPASVIIAFVGGYLLMQSLAVG